MNIDSKKIIKEINIVEGDVMEIINNTIYVLKYGNDFIRIYDLNNGLLDKKILNKNHL